LAEFAIGTFPLFFWHDDEFIYGFPVYGEVATKAAFDVGKAVTAETRTYDPDPEMEHRLEMWLQRHIPQFRGSKVIYKNIPLHNAS
jgi:sarcosine oxidase